MKIFKTTKIRLVFIYLIAMTASAISSAGPFGLEMGMSKEDLSKLGILKKPEGRDGLIIEGLKNGHPDIEEYELVWTPAHGLCKIIAWAPPIKTNAYGNAVISQFKNFKEALNKKYGASSDYDFLVKQSIWKRPGDWTTALAKEDRHLASYWQLKILPDSLDSVSLSTYGIDKETALIRITYEFKNFAYCSNTLKNQRNSNL